VSLRRILLETTSSTALFLGAVLTAQIFILNTYAQGSPIDTSASQPISPGTDAIVALVTAIATVVTTVGGMLAVLLPKIKTNSQELEKAKEIAIEEARAASFAARGILENKEEIKTVVDYGVNLAPTEAQLALEKNKAKLEEVTKEIEIKRNQFERLIQMIPKEGQIELVQEFPR
jgi:hypothetical protein